MAVLRGVADDRTDPGGTDRARQRGARTLPALAAAAISGIAIALALPFNSTAQTLCCTTTSKARKQPDATTLIDLPLPNRTHRGKVRDTYDLGDGRLLIIATDRISAFDVVLPNGIPDKGNVLTQMAAFWFEMTQEVVPNHFIRLADGTPADKLPFALPDELKGRSTIARKAQALPVECIARGYLTGSAWAEYKEAGKVCGVRMPPGMVEIGAVPRADLHADHQG